MSDFLSPEDSFTLDDRTLLSRLRQLQAYCRLIPFGQQLPPSWAEIMFANKERLEEPLDLDKLLDPGKLAWLYQNPDQANGRMAPHQAFLLAFLRMQETPRDLLNQLPAAHRQLYYRGLLGLKERPAVADQVAVSFRLNETTPELYLPAGTLLDAGQDSQGNPARYSLQESLLANHAQWTDLRWCRSADSGSAEFCHIAYDRDNGVPWPQQGIRLFEPGAEDVPLETGRVVSSAVLAMSGGIREITVTLEQAVDATTISAEISSDSVWLRLDASTTKADPTTELMFSLGADAGPVTPAPGLDGFHELTPLLKLYRCDGGRVPTVTSLSVDVKNLPDVFFSTDDGSASIDGRSYPFGNEPILGVGLNLVAADWYGKPGKITVSLQPEWMDLPPGSFVDWYKEYKAATPEGTAIITNDDVFKVQAAIGSRGGVEKLDGDLASLFEKNPKPARAKVSSMASPSVDHTIQIQLPGLIGNMADSKDPQDWPSWLRLELAGQNFQHAHYWRVLASQKADEDPIQINAPYTPQWKRLQVGYSCIDATPKKQYVLAPFGYAVNAPHVQIVDEEYRWCEEDFRPQDALSGKDYGRVVCVSADGSVLAVGAPDAKVEDTLLAGAVYLYRFNGQHWLPWQTISAQEKKAGSKFGAALSLSADGRVLVVGAPQYGDAEAKTGAVYMFRRNTDQWQEEEVTHGEENGDQFGGAISLSADGSVLAVGASGAKNGTANHGAIYLFRHTEPEWRQEAKLTEDRYAGNLGRSVSLSADGTVLAAGAPSMVYENKGRVLVFRYNVAAWSTPGTHIARPGGDKNYVDFGWSVSLTADGGTLAIGCRRDVYDGGAPGRVYLFDYKEGKWPYSNVELKPNPPVGSTHFSSSLSFSGDGLSLAVGAPTQNTVATSAAYLFKKEKDKWVERIKVDYAGQPANAWLGTSVSLSANGDVFAMGAVATNANTTNGFVRVSEAKTERPELYLGFRNVSPKEDLSLHWQLQSPRPLDISWQYLRRDNFWTALDASVTDHTDRLFRSGLWFATVPQDAATDAPMMPSGRVWLRALMAPVRHNQADAPSSVATSNYPWLHGLHTNGGMAVRVNEEAPDALVFDGPLAPGSITQPLQAIEGLESIDQPWPSQGGRAPESGVEFTQRVAKQLDHRGRALTWRDMKTLLLVRYPEIYDVLPVFLSAGQTQAWGRRQRMLVIPVNGQMDNADPLCPAFNPARLTEMAQYLRERASPWLELELLNPVYRKISVNYQVVFTAGVNAAYGDKQLQLALARHYMPWTYDQTSAIHPGDHLDYYGMVKFIQQLPFVDSVKALTLNGKPGNIQSGEDEVLILSLPLSDAENTTQAVDLRNDDL